MRHVYQRPLAIDGVAQPIHHPAQQARANGHFHDVSCAADRIALAYGAVVTENHDTDIVGFQVQRHAAQASAGEFHHFAGHDVLQAEHAGNTVTHRQHLPRFRHICGDIEGSNLLLQDIRYFCRTDLHLRYPLHGELQALQPRFDAAVEQARSDADDEAPQQRCIDPFLDMHLSITGLDQPRPDLLALHIA